MINWDKFDTEKYFDKSYALAKSIDGKDVRVMPVVTARGCAFRCTFAILYFGMIHTGMKPSQHYQLRNIQLYDCNYISFWDDLSFASIPQAGFVDAIMASKLKFNWSAAVRVDPSETLNMIILGDLN